MTTAIDSNVLIALWDKDDSLHAMARSALDSALGRGGLVIAAPVFAELLATPSRTEAFLDSFCRARASPCTGNSTRRHGGWQGVLSSSMLPAAEGSAIQALATFSLI